MPLNLISSTLLLFSKDSMATDEQKQWASITLASAAPCFYTDAMLEGKAALGKEFLSVEKLLETFLTKKYRILMEIVDVSKTPAFNQFCELFSLKLGLMQLDACIEKLEKSLD